MNFIVNAPRMISCVVEQYKTKTAPFQLKSQDNRVAVITGGNSGIGYQTALLLAKQGCEVIILCRNLTKAAKVVNEINTACTEVDSIGKCSTIELDLADLESVKRCEVNLRQVIENRKVDYFICNGGIMYQPYSKSPQGYEITFATNHLGHFALVGILFDLIKKSNSQVIILTGDIAVFADDASPDFVYNDDGLIAYCRSKICNQSFARELHKRYNRDLTRVYTVHPGVISSNLVAPATGIAGWIESFIKPFMMIDCKKGAQSTLYCLLTEEGTVPSGSYFHNVYGVTPHHPTAARDDWSEAMWNTSVDLCNKAGITLKF